MPRSERPRALFGLPPLVWALGVVSLLTDSASDLVYPLLPALLASVGGGALLLGLMEGVAEAASAALKVLSGRAVDRGAGRGGLVVLGYGVAALARPLLAFVAAPWQVIALRSVDRMGKGIRQAPRDALLAAAVEPSHRGRAFGVHRAMDNLGAVVGSLAATLLLGVAELEARTVIALSLVPGILSTLTATYAVKVESSLDAASTPRAPTAEQPAASAPVASTPLGKPVRRLLAAVTLFSLGASADSFLLAHLTAQGLPLPLLPIAWLSLQLGKSLLNLPGGWLVDRFGARRTLLASWLVYALSYVGFAWSPSAALTWALFALYALHYGLGEGSEKALLVELAPTEARGRALGWLHALGGGALLPANLLFGALYLVDPRLAFGLSAALALTAGALLAGSAAGARPGGARRGGAGAAARGAAGA